MEVIGFERRIKHYSSNQKILLVGEGDFSFAVCLARALGSAANIVATSLDSREVLVVNYSKAMINLRELELRGCIILHGVDVHTMSHHPFLMNFQFDCIIYNFPHAGYMNGSSSSERCSNQIRFHQRLVWGYLKSARKMVTADGEIHVTHMTSFPFSLWKIVELAEHVGLYLLKEEGFSKWDYPGYENKRGAGICNQTFPVGACSTFRFAKQLFPSHTCITSSFEDFGSFGSNYYRLVD